MSEALDALEHAEHAAHAGGHGHASPDSKPHGPGKLIGLTMALIGVLIAFCAALVAVSAMNSHSP